MNIINYLHALIETSEHIRSKVQMNYERLCKQLLLEEAGRLTDD